MQGIFLTIEQTRAFHSFAKDCARTPMALALGETQFDWILPGFVPLPGLVPRHDTQLPNQRMVEPKNAFYIRFYARANAPIKTFKAADLCAPVY